MRGMRASYATSLYLPHDVQDVIDHPRWVTTGPPQQCRPRPWIRAQPASLSAMPILQRIAYLMALTEGQPPSGDDDGPSGEARAIVLVPISS